MTTTTQRGLLGPSTVMAAGTIVSRLTGFGRAMIIAAGLGLGVTADTFNVPNVIPTTLYILVAGGVLNSVLVPALVRAIKGDADGGVAYSQRLFSVVVTVLGIATVVCVAAAPWIVRAFVSPEFLTPRLEPFFENMVMFARFCLPQIFFYGLYVLIGQMLNARGRFGPMMWAPILNNVVAIAVFAAFIVVMGTNTDRPFTDTEVLLLGLGSTAGVAAQALILLPVLRRTGFRIRFRTDWRHAGLGQAARLGLWTIAFVLVNQVAYLFVVRTATGGAASAFVDANTTGAGFSVYANAMLIMMVPHSVITVSLATALLPQLSDYASDGNVALLRDRLTDAVRLCLAVIVPIAALLAALSVPLVALLFDHGAAADDTGELAATLAALVPGLIAFTVHYLVLRGFYALQDTRTPFFVQLWVSGTVIAVAIVIAAVGPARDDRAVGRRLQPRVRRGCHREHRPVEPAHRRHAAMGHAGARPSAPGARDGRRPRCIRPGHRAGERARRPSGVDRRSPRARSRGDGGAPAVRGARIPDADHGDPRCRGGDPAPSSTSAA